MGFIRPDGAPQTLRWARRYGHDVHSVPLTDHTGWVDAVAAVPLPDGRTLLATGSLDGTVRLWDPTTGATIGKPLTDHTSAMYAVAAVPLPDGRTRSASPAWRAVSGSNPAHAGIP